ncbi:hypothetical protein [Paenibacillus flagellatus]|uniref:Type II secretion system protein GspF domain-containing protein n=1 Tax=Paenibacillus flagellatus TaxID=2211139 RepID=A0A2V5JXN0_9BACL|nr:hypothetical protein [Paenibacillus flagellatus]PYI51619.1 hypothetical protein DLM86_24745 [Paenibacillus flagellatus]
MIIESEHLFWLRAVTHAALFGALFTVFYHVFHSWPRRRRRWPTLALRQWVRGRNYPSFLLKAFGLSGRADGFLEAKERLLARGGLRIDPVAYELLRRVAMLGAVAIAAIGYSAARGGWRLPLADPIGLLTGGAVAVVLLVFDRTLLEAFGKHRSQRIMKEIFVLSNQLLYYAGSKMSLHAKLTRCVPFSRTVRADLQLLLHEWYEDAEQAIRRFKRRLGTEEAYSFAETINSLRLNEHGSYYSLLRERIQDYKEKLELARDSRKETTSYVLFVIAGVPILNTFRIFVYPWVQEGQKLFDALG